MEYFRSFSQSAIIELIIQTKTSLFLCLPSIHAEVADAITYLSYSSSQSGYEVDIHLLIDFDSQTFRQGYGDYKTVESLLSGNFEVNTFPNNRISFIISDEIGYYLFVESRSLIPTEKETINAIKIDPVSLIRLKKYFFSTSSQIDFEDQLTNAIIKESKALNDAQHLMQINSSVGREISLAERDLVAKDIKSNPPLHPDYKRIVEMYSNKFQYVKLEFEGANLKHKKIQLPPKALPIKDAKLKKRLETRFNLFDLGENKGAFSEIDLFKEKIVFLREKYLTKIKSREESLLDKKMKQSFNAEVETLRNEIKDIQMNLLTNTASLIEQTKESLLGDLEVLFIENPKEIFSGQPHLWEGNSEYIKKEAKSKAEEIIYRIHWPSALSLLGECKLDVKYSDITFEDLKNTRFINELKESGLIDSNDENLLAEFSKVIKV